MPMQFTDKMVEKRAAAFGMDPKSPKLRELVANETAARFHDYVEAWEIETGRPWTEMTKDEAEALIKKYPSVAGNIGVLTRLAAVQRVQLLYAGRERGK